MSAPAWTGIGRCVRCDRENIEVLASRAHGERVLCQSCVARPFSMPSANGLDSTPATKIAAIGTAPYRTANSSLPAGAGRAGGAASQQEQDARGGLATRQRKPVPVPTPAPAPAGSKEPTELELLISEHRAGRLQPADVKLGELPAAAGTAQRAVADHIRWLMGLRLAVGDDRPLPYATSMAVKAGLVADQGTASAVIRALVRFRVIDYVGALRPLRPGLDGTKLYAPPGEARARDLGATG